MLQTQSSNKILRLHYSYEMYLPLCHIIRARPAILPPFRGFANLPQIRGESTNLAGLIRILKLLG